MPSVAELSESGVKAAGSKGKSKASPLEEAMEAFRKAGETSKGSSNTGLDTNTESNAPLVSIGCGLAALSKKLLDKIEAGEYIEFSELPPARGKGCSMTQSFEGQVVVIQAADLVQTRKLIPDMATWIQCFGLFTTAVARRHPERVPDLMAYMAIIAKASQKYKWPSWIIYDQYFRLEVGGQRNTVVVKGGSQYLTRNVSLVRQ